MLPRYRRVILDKLKRTAGMEDIEERIVVEHALTPQDIHERYRVLNGAIYGLASHGKFAGAFKPGNRSRFIWKVMAIGAASAVNEAMCSGNAAAWAAASARSAPSNC